MLEHYEGGDRRTLYIRIIDCIIKQTLLNIMSCAAGGAVNFTLAHVANGFLIENNEGNSTDFLSSHSFSSCVLVESKMRTGV